MGQRSALFGEMLLTGVLVFLASLGVVTAVPAAIAGAAHLRRHVEGIGTDRRAAAVHDLVTAARRLPGAATVLVVVPMLSAWNVVACLTCPVAGGPVVAAVSAAVGVLTAITALRLVGSWTPADEGGSADVVRRTLRLGTQDPTGSVLLLAALIAVVGFCRAVPILTLAAPGPLVLAAIAVESRRTEPFRTATVASPSAH